MNEKSRVKCGIKEQTPPIVSNLCIIAYPDLNPGCVMKLIISDC